MTDIDIAQTTEQMANATITEPSQTTQEKKRVYCETQCYTSQEFKDLINDENIFGVGTKLVKGSRWTKGREPKLIVRVSLPGGGIKEFPLKATEMDKKIYINKRSLNFFKDKNAGRTTSDLDDLIDG